MAGGLRLLKGHKRPDGHLEVNLWQGERPNARRVHEKVHRLIRITFGGPCQPGMECRHLNGNAEDNHLSNLCWGTQAENMQDCVRHGTSYLVRQGETHPSSRLKEAEVLEIERLCHEGTLSQDKIALHFGIGHSQVSAIALHRAWPYLWVAE